MSELLTEATESAVARGPIYRLLLRVLLGFVPGLVAVDLWVGWLDRAQTDTAEESEYYLRDEQLGWRPRPHFSSAEFETSLDRWGMRNPDIPSGADPTEVRILGVGASRLYGAGCVQSQIWSTLLEEELSRGPLAGRVRIFNGAVMGYSAVQSSRRAIALLPEVEPDLVFVVVSPGAQLLLDPSAARQWLRMEDGELVRSDIVDGWPEPLWPVAVALHEALLSSALYTRHMAKFQIENEDRPERIQRWVLTRAQDTGLVADMLARTFDELAALRDAVAAVGAELRLLVMPEHYQDAARHWRGYCAENQAMGAPPLGTPRNEPTDVLAEMCQALGLEVWRFDEEIERIGADRKTFLAEDERHWSPVGHRVIANGLRRRLIEGGLIERLAQRRAQNHRQPSR